MISPSVRLMQASAAQRMTSASKRAQSAKARLKRKSPATSVSATPKVLTAEGRPRRVSPRAVMASCRGGGASACGRSSRVRGSASSRASTRTRSSSMAGGRGGVAVAAALWARMFTAEARRLNENRPPKSRTGAGEGAERRLEQLAGRPLRQRGHERDAHRALEIREAGRAPGEDLALVQVRARARGEEGPHDLAVERVGRADHGGLRHRRVREQRLLDLARVDVLAAADDELARASDDVEEAVPIEAAEVARTEPPAAHRRPRRPRRPE